MADTSSEVPKNTEAKVPPEVTQPSAPHRDAYNANDFRQVFQKLGQTDNPHVPLLEINATGPLRTSDFANPDHRPYNERLVEKQNGVLQINVNFRGASPSHYVGSGFPVNRDGTRLREYDGTQYIASADHVIHDRQKEIYKILDEQFDKILEQKAGGVTQDGRITKQDLINQQKQSVFEAAAQEQNASPILSQFDYAINHFNEISHSKNPNATISRDDLKKFYDKNTEITVVTPGGKRFHASIAASDAPNDLAVLKVSCLNPIQQGSFAPNFDIARNDPRPGETMQTLGFNGVGNLTVHEGAVWGKGQGVNNDSQNFYVLTQPIDHGNSGGPALDKRTLQVVGINHATSNVESLVASPQKLLRLLSKIPLEKPSTSCYLSDSATSAKRI
jgi:Trypsin-like peptidase domain